MISIPLELLNHHVKQTSKDLSDLINCVEEIENIVATNSHHGTDKVDFSRLIHRPHSCNTNLIKLERVWHFEFKLAHWTQDFIDSHRNFTHSNNVKMGTPQVSGKVSACIQNNGPGGFTVIDPIEFRNLYEFKNLDSKCVL
jgi:hypothetical protein